MGRRSSVIEDLMQLPWPIGAVMALLCYPFALLLSAYFENQSSNISQALSSVPLKLWPWFSAMFGFASIMSFVTERKKKNLYKQNQSLQQIRDLTWRQFEFYIGQAFREKGYFVAETPEGPDGGVDLVLRKDGEKTFVQCKHWKLQSVGVERVRELLGSVVAGGADHGVLVATGNFTSSAISFAQQNGIILINGNELERMISIGLEESEANPEPVDDEVICPVCKSTMIKRTAKKGKNAGQRFWGCSKYPKCLTTRSLQ